MTEPVRTVSQQRWPGWVFDQGEEPDYRFSLANERTFLAWVRTALALVAGGVAVAALDLDIPDPVQVVLAIELILLGGLCVVLAWVRWASAERAMRLSRPLPGARTSIVLAGGVLLASVLLLIVGPALA
jgi:putative membrane protein